MGKEYICNKINNLYKNFCLNDFFIQAKEDYLNPDIEDYVYVELAVKDVYDILADEIIYDQFSYEKLQEKYVKNAIILSSNDAIFAYILYYMYYFKKIICIENTHEFCSLLISCREYFYKSIENDKKTQLEVYNKQILKANLKDKDLIILNYNSTNQYYWNMIENKIIDEAKIDSIIIKPLTPFKQNISLKLLKIKKIMKDENEMLIFFYKKY